MEIQILNRWQLFSNILSIVSFIELLLFDTYIATKETFYTVFGQTFLNKDSIFVLNQSIETLNSYRRLRNQDIKPCQPNILGLRVLSELRMRRNFIAVKKVEN